MSPSNRQAEIVRDLRVKNDITESYFAAKFDVCKKTIRRDVAELIANHFPIITVPGRGGGIRLTETINPHRDIFTIEQNEGLAEMYAETTNPKHRALIVELLKTFGRPLLI